MSPVHSHLVTALLLLGAGPCGCYSSFDGARSGSPQHGAGGASEASAPGEPGARQSRGAGAAGEQQQTKKDTQDTNKNKKDKKDKQEEQEEQEEQSYQVAWRLICAAERLSGADPTATRSERGATVAAWIVDHVKNKRARYWFIQLGLAQEAEKAALFRAEARRAGQAECPLHELLFGGAAPQAAPSRSDSQAPAGRSGPDVTPGQKPFGTSP